MKKLLIIVPVFIFAFALTASAGPGGNGGGGSNGGNGGCGDCNNGNHEEQCCPSVDVTNFNGSIQGVKVDANANTGSNGANGNWGLGKIDTGSATTMATLNQQAGFSTVEIGTPWTPFTGGVSVSNHNFAAQGAEMNAGANTGYNSANGNKGLEIKGSLAMSRCVPTIKVSGGTTGAGKITTGNAKTTANAWQTTGVNVVKVNAAPSSDDES